MGDNTLLFRPTGGPCLFLICIAMPALTLTPAARAEFRSQAHALKPVILIGGEGLTDAVLAETDRALTSHQLIKVRVFGDERETRIETATTLCDQLNAGLVQHIGKLLVLYRPAPSAKPSRDTPQHDAKRATGPVSRAAAARAVAELPASGNAPGKAKGAAPRMVKVIKPTGNERRRARPKDVLVRGNERVTAGGNIKRAKKRKVSVKRMHQSD